MKKCILTCTFFFSTIIVFAQEIKPLLYQKIKGQIVDADSRLPLQGVTVILSGGSEQAISDAEGFFSISRVEVGKHILELSRMGYEPKVISDITVNSGKEVFLNISMVEKVGILDDIVIRARKNRFRPNNEFATLSARSFSMEDTKRFPAAGFDPARMAQNFAGVSSNGDFGNEIVIRGNSPRGMLWRLEGIEIPNPNHFGSLGTSGGAISMLSSSTLGSSDFYTGAFPAEFGNATSGVFDLNFRNGNKDKREYALMIGGMGLEAAAEGPFKKGNASSYLINYRYSTVSLMAGFLDLDGIAPSYQDLSFKFNFPTKKAGTFSIFGLGGLNKAVKKPTKDSTKWDDDNPNFVLDAPGRMGVGGIIHQIFLNKNAYLKTVLSVSGRFASSVFDTLNPAENYQAINIGREKDIDAAYRASILFNNKFSNRSTLRAGINVNRLSFDYNNTYYDDVDGEWEQRLAASGSSMYYQAYIQWKYLLTRSLTLNTGIHSSLFGFNNTYSLEPRLALSYKAVANQVFSLAVGLHARPDHLSTYYFTLKDANNTAYTPNRDLEMSKALHVVLGYDKTFPGSIRLKTELYYQHLYDVPVERKAGSYFSMLNSSGFYDLTDIGPLVNDGKGKNYGIELTVEKMFSDNYYFLGTGSLYESKYTNYDNKTYNTRYNGNYQLNLVGGKEWKLNQSSHYILGVNAKLLTSGGLRNSEIDLEASRTRGKVIYVADRYFTDRGNPYFRFDLGISFKMNRKKSTHIYMLDFQNLINFKNLYTSYYDNKSGSIKKIYQTGIFPIFNYRLEF